MIQVSARDFQQKFRIYKNCAEVVEVVGRNGVEGVYYPRGTEWRVADKVTGEIIEKKVGEEPKVESNLKGNDKFREFMSRMSEKERQVASSGMFSNREAVENPCVKCGRREATHKWSGFNKEEIWEEDMKVCEVCVKKDRIPNARKI